MAKKAGKQKHLTNEQVKELAGVLLDSTKNVYTECKRLFAIDEDESVFERLAEVGCAKCIECNVWLSLDAWSDDCTEEELESPCDECRDRIDGYLD